MSNIEQLQTPEGEQDESTYINNDEVGEVVEETVDEDHPMSEEEDEFDEAGNIEIDRSNNSSAFFDEHKDAVYLIDTHPSLPMVVTGSGDEMGYLWTTHLSPPKLVAKLTGHQESLVAGGFTSDGKFLVTADMNGQVRVWRSKSGGEKWEFFTSVQEVEEIICLKFHPKLPIFALGAKDGSVWVYELGAKLSNISVLSAHAMPTNDVAFVDVDNQERLTIVSASEDSSIICWDAYQNQVLYNLGPTELKGEHPWVVLCLSPSGRTISAGSYDGTLVVIKLDNGALLQQIDTAGDTTDDESRSIEAIAWSDKTNLVAVGNVGGQIKLYDIASWKVRTTLQLEGAVTKLYFLPGTSRLISSGYDSSLIMWDVITGEKVWECVGHSAGVLGFAVQNNGKRIISAGEESVCLVFDEPSA